MVVVSLLSLLQLIPMLMMAVVVLSSLLPPVLHAGLVTLRNVMLPTLMKDDTD